MPQFSQNNDEPGHDSFLDIVANMVGILIILVMVVGVRIKNVTQLPNVDLPPPAESEPTEDSVPIADAQAIMQSLADSIKNERAMRADVTNMLAQRNELSSSLMIAKSRGEMTAVAVAEANHKIKAKESDLDQSRVETLNLSRRITDLEDEREKVVDEMERIDRATDDRPTVLLNHPTPMGKKQIDRKEVLFQLLGGRLAFIPINKLMSARKASLWRQRDTLLRSGYLEDSIGPIGGFRMNSKIAIERGTDPRTGTPYFRESPQCTLEPTSNQMGESVESALLPGSDFHTVVDRCSTSRDTITIWTYTDSFADFRKLQKYLSERGFSVAARPLPIGMPIGFSPHGSRSIAQ